MPVSRRRALAALGGTFALPLLPARSWAAGPATLTVAGAPDDDITPILYADSAGLFKKHGIEVKFQKLTSGAATAAAVAGGTVDVGKSSLTALIAARSRGVPFKILTNAALYLESYPIAGLVVPKDSTIKTGRDFNGKTMSASSLKDLIAVASQSWVDQNGGDSKTVKFIEIPSSAVPAALQQRKVDGATLVTPALAEAMEGGENKLIARPFSAIAKRFLVAGWFTSEESLTKNRDAIRRFVEAFREAAAYTDKHHEETVALLAASSKLSPQIIRSMVRATAGGAVDAKDIEPVIAASVKYGVIAKAFPAQDLIATVR